MTHLDRALTKAYTHRPAVKPPAQAAATETNRGWVSKVRIPVQCAAEKSTPPTIALSSAPSIDNPQDNVSSGDLPILAAPAALPQLADEAAGGEPYRETAPAGETAAETSAPPEPQDAQDSNRHWPAITDRLLDSSAAADLRRVGLFLESLPEEKKLCSIAFCGPGRRVGRTSVLLTLARLLAEEAELRVLLVDADVDQPELAQSLGVAPLTAADFGSPALDDRRFAVVNWSLEGVTGRGVVEESKGHDADPIVAGWRESFDVVLIDAGTWGTAHRSGLIAAGAVDAIVSVRRFDAVDDGAALRLCREWDVRMLGVVETFVPATLGEGSQAA